MDDEALSIPHPRMKERAFVLVPIFELEPELKINNTTIKSLLSDLDTTGVRKI
jgi:2-amino-4-hydroxy-6-hydroxymethyldihydropteridine diphosphokinase